MRVLVACEYSGTVRDAFIARGHDAMSCDLLPTEKPGPHYQGDVRDVIGNEWDMAVCHPPCTRLCNSGVAWLEKRNLWGDLSEAAAFFRLFLECDIERVAIENPIPHKYAMKLIGRRYDQVIQPWWFGHGETKATCLWLKNLPPLISTGAATGRSQRLHRLPPGPERARERSRTYPGIANAMAEQWGSMIYESTLKPL